MDFLKSHFLNFVNLMNTFTVYDFFDIIIVAILIYAVTKIVRDSRAGQLVKGITIIIFAYFLASQLNFKMLSFLLNNLFQFSVFGLLIVFQPELRRALEQLGRNDIGKYWSSNYIKKEKSKYDALYLEIINIVKNSIISLCDSKMGALIVFEKKTKIGEIIDTGTIIRAKPSVELICNIFYNKAPLHDGAMVIKDGTIYAGGCILPLTKNQNLNTSLGTRHRAALGVSEVSDAVVLVVSEETGKVSIANNGKLIVYDDINTFENDLKKLILT